MQKALTKFKFRHITILLVELLYLKYVLLYNWNWKCSSALWGNRWWGNRLLCILSQFHSWYQTLIFKNKIKKLYCFVLIIWF